MTLTRQDEIKELKEKIANLRTIKYPDFVVRMSLNNHEKKLKKLEDEEANLSKREN